MMKKTVVQRALSLYGRLILASVMGVFMYLSVGVITTALTQNTQTLSAGASFAMNLVALVIQGFLTLSIVYAEMAHQGDKDSGPAMFGGVHGNPHTGLWVGLVASAPALLSWLVLIAEKLFGFWGAYAAVYRLGQLSLYPLVVWSLGAEVMVPAARIGWGGIVAAVIPTLIIVAAAWVSYYVSYRQLGIAKRLIYKKKSK